jgi:hypothetical protein
MLGVTSKPFVFSIVMLNVIMLSVIMLSVIKLNVILLSDIMLSVIMLSVIMLSVIMLSVIMLSVIMFSVVAPFKYGQIKFKDFHNFKDSKSKLIIWGRPKWTEFLPKKRYGTFWLYGMWE